jgi:hypothetical protein
MDRRRSAAFLCGASLAACTPNPCGQASAEPRYVRGASRTICVQPGTVHFGVVEGVPACDVLDDNLVLFVGKASCVVDHDMRIVVSDVGVGALYDTAAHAAAALPSFPMDKFVPIQLPIPRLNEKDRHLLIQLSGACGSEQAAGAFQCDLRALHGTSSS